MLWPLRFRVYSFSSVMSENIVCGSSETHSSVRFPSWPNSILRLGLWWNAPRGRRPWENYQERVQLFHRAAFFLLKAANLLPLIPLLYLLLPRCLFCMWPVKLCKWQSSFSHGSNFSVFNSVLFKLQLYPAQRFSFSARPLSSGRD